MTWLVFLYFLECGMVPYENPPLETPQQMSYYTAFDAEILIAKYVFFGGSTRCLFTSVPHVWRFRPEVMEYSFRAGIIVEPLEIGWRHQCNHRRIYLNSMGGYSEFYIRISNLPRAQPGN